MNEPENPAAVLGRRGGRARAKALGPQQRKLIARKAASSRWGTERGFDMSDPTVAGTAIYHRIHAHEDHDTSAMILWNLVRRAIQEKPKSCRVLYLDIDGHRNAAGAWDAEMFDLQQQFIIGYLGQFISEVHMPIGHIVSQQAQSDDMPERLEIGDGAAMLAKALGPYDRALLDRAYTAVTGKTTKGLTDELAAATVGKIVFGADRKLAEQMIQAVRTASGAH